MVIIIVLCQRRAQNTTVTLLRGKCVVCSILYVNKNKSLCRRNDSNTTSKRPSQSVVQVDAQGRRYLIAYPATADKPETKPDILNPKSGKCQTSIRPKKKYVKEREATHETDYKSFISRRNSKIPWTTYFIIPKVCEYQSIPTSLVTSDHRLVGWLVGFIHGHLTPKVPETDIHICMLRVDQWESRQTAAIQGSGYLQCQNPKTCQNQIGYFFQSENTDVMRGEFFLKTSH